MQRHVSRRLNRVVLAVIGSTVCACGHGAPEYSASIADYDTPPGAPVTVALRSFSVTRPAWGLSAFPDGGIAIVVDQGVEVNVCEQHTGIFRQIAVLHEPVHSRTDFSTPVIVQWLDTAVRLSRYTGGDTVVRLPPGLHAGVSIKDSVPHMHGVSLPECETSLAALRDSKRMPDGTRMSQ